jgi:cytochrome c oxidase assembly protein subunit 15
MPTEPLSLLAQAADAAGAPSVEVVAATPLSTLLVLFVVGSALVVGVASRISTVHLALGFATTVAMWAIGYVAMMAPGLWIGELLFALTLAMPILFGAVARRGGASPLKVGLVSAFANLLIIGAFLRDEQQGSLLAPVLYVAGLFVASGALAAFGGFLARKASPLRLPSPAGLFAAVSAATVFILLVTGGLVTGLESGLAVPDWPNSFGHNMLLYPISEMKGGIYYEHAHRLFGMLVGSTALVLNVVVWREDARGWVRGLAAAFLAFVCVQGLFGGLRVTGTITVETDPLMLTPNTVLAIVHGMFGQIVLALACAIACISSNAWKSSAPAASLVGAGRLRVLPFALLAVLLVQLFLGASYRHLQIPPADGNPAVHPAWPIWGHVIGAFVVVVLAVATGATASSRGKAFKPLRILGKGLVHGVGLQFALGLGALVVVLIRVDARIPAYEVITTSAHQALGAVLLSVTAMLAAWSLRLVPEPEAEAAVIQSSRAA